MLSKILAFPLMLVLLAVLYIAWETDSSYAIYIVPIVLLLVAVYIFQPQLDWWWYRRRPPELDDKMQKMLERFHPFYRQLSATEKRRFRERVVLYAFAKEYIPKAFDEVPEDVQIMVAVNAVHLTFGQPEYLLPKYERIVVYPQPFPSPQYPKQFHASEIFDEDGVILFSAEQLMAAMMNPVKYYNIGLHEYANVFMRSFPDHDYPKWDEFVWEKLEQVSGFTKSFITAFIGLDDIDPLPVGICLFFSFPLRFRNVLPIAYENFRDIFNLDPVLVNDPVVKKKLLAGANSGSAPLSDRTSG